MIYTTLEYSKIKKVSHDTIRRMILKNILPSNCKVKKLLGKRGYLIEVTEKSK
jgi:hypothetical protein